MQIGDLMIHLYGKAVVQAMIVVTGKNDKYHILKLVRIMSPAVSSG